MGMRQSWGRKKTTIPPEQPVAIERLSRKMAVYRWRTEQIWVSPHNCSVIAAVSTSATQDQNRRQIPPTAPGRSVLLPESMRLPEYRGGQHRPA